MDPRHYSKVQFYSCIAQLLEETALKCINLNIASIVNP